MYIRMVMTILNKFCVRTRKMTFKYIPFFLTLVVANPVLNIMVPQPLEHPLLEATLGRHLKSFAVMSQNFKNLQQPLLIPKNLITSHLKVPNLGVQMGEGITSHHLSSLGFESSLQEPVSAFYPILANVKQMEHPQNIIAGAVIKEVSKASKFPINIAYLTNTLGFNPIGQSGGLESALSGIPAEYSGGGFNTAQSIALGY